jgi:hypothetical protein
MVTNLAMSYGKDFVGRGQQEIKKSIDKYVSIGQLKVLVNRPAFEAVLQVRILIQSDPDLPGRIRMSGTGFGPGSCP